MSGSRGFGRPTDRALRIASLLYGHWTRVLPMSLSEKGEKQAPGPFGRPSEGQMVAERRKPQTSALLGETLLSGQDH